MIYPIFYLGDQWFPRIPDFPASPYFVFRWADGKVDARANGLYQYSMDTEEWSLFDREAQLKDQNYPFIAVSKRGLRPLPFPLIPPPGYRPLYSHETQQGNDVICSSTGIGSHKWITLHDAFHRTPMNERVPEYRLKQSFILRKMKVGEEYSDPPVYITTSGGWSSTYTASTATAYIYRDGELQYVKKS